MPSLYVDETDAERGAIDVGCHVIVTARDLSVIEHLQDPNISVMQLDVTKADSIARCKEKVIELTGGRLDILVNNAYVRTEAS